LAEAGLDQGLPPWPSPNPAASKPVAWEFSFKLNADGHIWRGNAAYAHGDFAQAEADYREVLRQQPNSVSACNDLAWLYVIGPPPFRKPCEGLALALAAVRQDAHHYHLNTLGVAYYRLGRWQEAIYTLNKAVKAKPIGATAWDAFFLAMSHHRLGHHAEARKFFDQAIALRASGSPPRPRDKAELDEMETEARIVLSQGGDR
jgi:tetratricopeptide (TPR) repeat protein